jgi:hypothetical protein
MSLLMLFIGVDGVSIESVGEVDGYSGDSPSITYFGVEICCLMG